jgi:hypothetical protein
MNPQEILDRETVSMGRPLELLGHAQLGPATIIHVRGELHAETVGNRHLVEERVIVSSPGEAYHSMIVKSEWKS